MRITLSSHLRYCARLSLFSFSFIYFMRVINIVKVNEGNSVFFVPCCSDLLSFYLILSYMFELYKWRWRRRCFGSVSERL